MDINWIELLKLFANLLLLGVIAINCIDIKRIERRVSRVERRRRSQ